MGFDADEEILQDFLVEAGEIIELLSEQLIDLEQRPDDADLLNAIFRGFHTVKGGAGFLQLNPLVDCCHVAENIFDLLRNDQQVISAELMDVVLRALDAVHEMFAQVNGGNYPEPADPELIKHLEYFAVPGGKMPSEESAPESVEQPAEEVLAEPKPEETAQPAVEPTSDATAGDASEAVKEFSESSEEITDDEFEKLLDALHPESSGESEKEAAPTEAASEPPKSAEPVDDLFDMDDGASASAQSSDEITESEFEALLDQLHGKQGETVAPVAESKADEPSKNEAPASPAPSDSNEITDDEFEKLLDDLHGAGKMTTPADGASSDAAPVEPKATQPEPEKPAVSPQPAASPAPAQSPTPAPAAKAPAKPEPAASKAPAASAGGAKGGNQANTGNQQEATVRVDTKRLDDIMNMVGELVLVRNRLVRLGTQLEDEVLQKAVANLNVVTADLQSSVMKTRMQPIKKVFGRFPRVVRDLARNLKKEVNLELVGEETDLDKNLVDALADPLVHLVRNSVDHGIESPAEREASGKSRTGRVILSAEQEGDHILLAIEDDGAGMNADKLRSIAVDRGVMDQDAADRLTEKDCFNLIFAPGFSTKTEISDISGRGVGMDVVKTKISQLNGTIDIDSEPGKGTKLLIKVPLTLAIMPTLMVMLDEQAFALPLVNVNEIFHLDLTKTNVVDGKEVVLVRGKPLPLFYLKRWLIQGANMNYESDKAHVVVVSVGTQKVGFVVDQLVGQEEVVIKPIGAMLQGTDGMAGATITGDGRIALILDVPSMLKRYA